MSLSREQFQGLRNQGLSVDQIVGFENGQTPQSMGQGREIKQATAGNQFQQEEPTSFMGKARDFMAGIVGGGKLAEGAGMALAAPGVTKQLQDSAEGLSSSQQKTIALIKQHKAEGKDTSRLEESLRRTQVASAENTDAMTDFTGSLPSTKQVIGSAARLATTAAGGSVLKGANNLTGASKAIGIGSGAWRGAAAGGLGGLVLGTFEGAGAGAEQDKDAGGILKSAALGGATGAVGGAALGAIGGAITGKVNQAKSEETFLQRVTPKTTDLSPTEYEKMRLQGRVQSKTLTRPEQIKLTDQEYETASKYSYLVHKDPATTINNITDQVAHHDEQVGAFLKKNNTTFDQSELRGKLVSALKDIDDVSIPEERLDKVKANLVDNFLKSLDKEDMSTLWQKRKEYDSAIERAFRGAPSATKDTQRALRNAVQDFIAEKTPHGVYKDYMGDMRNLIQLRDLVNMKGVDERGRNFISSWIKNNPLKAKVIGGAALLGVGGYGGTILSHSRSDSG